MNKTYKIAGLGEVLWDVHGDDFTFGGAPGNCACHCNSLGAKAYTISCIGDDQLGVKAKAFLDQHGINTTGLAISSEFETGIVNIELDFAGKRNIILSKMLLGIISLLLKRWLRLLQNWTQYALGH